MLRRFNANYLALFLLVDVLLLQAALFGWAGPALQHTRWPPWPHLQVESVRLELHLAVFFLGLLGFVSLAVYNPRRIMRWIDEFQRVVLANTVVGFSLMGALYILNIDFPRLGFLYFYGLSTLLLLSYRVVVRAVHRVRQNHPGVLTRILLVGAGKVGCEVVHEFRQQRWPGLDIVGFLDDDPAKEGTNVMGLPVLGTLSSVKRVVSRKKVDEVLIALPSRAHEKLNDLVALLYDQPVRVRVVPDFFDLAFHNATVESMGGILLIGLRDPAIDGAQRLAKRIMDIFFSLITLLLFSPVLIVTAIAIKLHDGGTIFYRSERIGENNRKFRMLKFRSMVKDADKRVAEVMQRDNEGNIIHKVQEDPRVTPVGRFIRRTSIDELPQLWNVLKGDMSLVGPRPELPFMVEKYQMWQRKRFAVPQGITGWWQINGRSDAPMHLHTEHDLYYIQNYSLWLDIQILWKTIGVIISGKGAY